MEELTILSPHRDDAAFSLSVCLSRWSKAPVRLTVLNFFTRTAYAPRTFSTNCSPVSAIRRMEDRRVLSAVSRSIGIKAVDLLDAPLRLGISSDSVCSSDGIGSKDNGTLETLRSALSLNGKHALLFAPLGLGNHVDHLVVHAAALRTRHASRLAFYEDLPYATWTPEADIKKRVKDTAQITGVQLRPVVILGEHAIWRKRRLIGQYQSQISADEAAVIARFAAKYGGGERIWIPRYSSRWVSFMNSYE